MMNFIGSLFGGRGAYTSTTASPSAGGSAGAALSAILGPLMKQFRETEGTENSTEKIAQIWTKIGMRQKINPNCWTGCTCLTQIRRPSQIFKISAGRSLSASAFIGVFQTCFLPTRIFTFLLLLNFQAVHQSPGRKGGICMQNFLYFLCRYGNVSQVPESQDRLAGFRIFPRFEGNSWGQDKWSGPYLPAGLSTHIITIIITGRLLGGKSSHSGDHKTYSEDFRICTDVLL